MSDGYGANTVATFGDLTAARAILLSRLVTERAIRLGRRVHGPDVDDAAMLIEPQDLEELPPIAFHFVYSDAKHALSGRCVTLRALKATEGDILVVCYCHFRRALRTFRAARIVELVELSTGEVFDAGMAYFCNHGLFHGERTAFDPDTLAVEAVRDEVIVLLFSAAISGGILEGAEDRIVLHVMDATPEPDVSEIGVRHRIRQFVPDDGALMRALGRLAFRGKSLAPLRRSLAAIFDLTAVVSDREVAFMAGIETMLTSAPTG